MKPPKSLSFTSSDLFPNWIIFILMTVLLLTYITICYLMGAEIQINLPEQKRVFIRTVLYVLAIALFPLVNLLRHILLKLNQTMPGDTPAKQRYFITTTLTLSLIESSGIFGLMMFILGDGYNTLIIFSVLAALGLFLHRPQENEYQRIMTALAEQRKRTD